MQPSADPWLDPELVSGMIKQAQHLGYPEWCIQAVLCLGCAETCSFQHCHADTLVWQSRPLAKMLARDMQSWAKGERIRRLLLAQKTLAP